MERDLWRNRHRVKGSSKGHSVFAYILELFSPRLLLPVAQKGQDPAGEARVSCACDQAELDWRRCMVLTWVVAIHDLAHDSSPRPINVLESQLETLHCHYCRTSNREDPAKVRL